MKKFKTHICLVNENAMENILPLLDPHISPAEVILCYSPSHEADAKMQRDYCLKQGLKVEMMRLPQKHSVCLLFSVEIGTFVFSRHFTIYRL